MDAKYLPEFNIKAKFLKVVEEEEELTSHDKNPRDEYALSKPELDRLFYAKIDDKESALIVTSLFSKQWLEVCG
jgi:hypothetical protein